MFALAKWPSVLCWLLEYIGLRPTCRYVSSGVCRLLWELQSYTGRVPVVGDAFLLPRIWYVVTSQSFQINKLRTWMRGLTNNEGFSGPWNIYTTNTANLNWYHIYNYGLITSVGFKFKGNQPSQTWSEGRTFRATALCRWENRGRGVSLYFIFLIE